MHRLKEEKLPILFRLTANEKKILKEKIHKSKLNQQEYLRFCSLSKNIIIYDFKELCEFNNHIYDIKNDIKKCLDKLNVDDIDIIKEVSKIDKKADSICLMLSEYLSKLQ